MIHKITIKNFLSFAEEQVIDFTVDENAPNTEVYREAVGGIRVTPILGVLGANAHGKTNLLYAIERFVGFALFSFGKKDKHSVLSAYHLNRKSDPVSFSIEFSNNSTVYVYKLELLNGELRNESLVERNGGPGRPAFLFKLERNENGLSIVGELVDDIKEQCKEILKDAKSTTLLSLLVGGMKKQNVLSIVSLFLSISNYADELSVSEVSKFYDKNPGIYEKVKEFLLAQDLGISDVSIKKIEKDGGDFEYHPRFSHVEDGDKSFEIGIGFESFGVRRLYAFLKEIFETLDVGGVLVCDELDRSMHPHILDKFLELFKAKETNPKNAQLIFTTHEAYVLNLLDKEQIGFVEKSNNKSSFYKLSDIKGVKARDNYFGKYMAGAYGATPNL